MRVRLLALSLLLGLPSLAGCSGNAGFDFIEAQGTLADGTPFNNRNLATTALVPSLLDPLGYVLAVGSPFTGPEDLRGFRIEWQPDLVGPGMSYPSDPNGPVVFYVALEAPDAGPSGEGALVVSGGLVSFTMITNKITGNLFNLVLTRDGVTVATVATGSFQATKP